MEINFLSVIYESVCPYCDEQLILMQNTSFENYCIGCRKVQIQCNKCNNIFLYEVPSRKPTHKEKKEFFGVDRVIELDHLKQGLSRDQYNDFLSKFNFSPCFF